MNKELAQERKEREQNRKLVTHCQALVIALENKVEEFKQEIATAEASHQIGKLRAQFQSDSKLIHEKGTLTILKVDEIGSCLTNESERTRARAERKKLVTRIEACSTSVASFL